MKRKQFIKQTRDIAEETILRHLEHNGRRLSDYFLVGEDGDYQQGTWGRDGKPTIWMIFSEDEVRDFAIEQYLLRHVPVYRTEAAVLSRPPEPEPT